MENELELGEEARHRENDELDSPFESFKISSDKNSERAELPTIAEDEDVEDDTVFRNGVGHTTTQNSNCHRKFCV